MIVRIAILAALCGAASVTEAGGFRISFDGTVISIDDDAPQSFSVGEHVSGYVDFSEAPKWTTRIVVSFALVDAVGESPAAWGERYYQGFPRDQRSYIVTEALSAGVLSISTASGFLVTDAESEFVAVRYESGSRALSSGGGSSFVAIGNRGRFAELYAFADVGPRTLQSVSGPTAAGVQLILSNIAFPPFDADDPTNALVAILNEDSFPGLTGGTIEFQEASGAFATPPAVEFVIDTVTITPIPEPLSTAPLATACVLLGGRRPGRPARR